jgi:hypothetical protein
MTASRNASWDKFYLKQREENRLYWLWWAEWLNMRGQFHELPNAGIADELVRQLAEGHAG